MTQDLLVPILRFLAYIGILLVATPLFGAAIMRKAFEKVAYRDASYGQLAKIYFAACASYVLAVPANTYRRGLANSPAMDGDREHPNDLPAASSAGPPRSECRGSQ